MVALYLAGPEVFLPQSRSVGANKKKICATLGHEGLFPLDADLPVACGKDLATHICRANIAMIEKSAAIVANLTPFRGPSADAGTIFEIGYALAMGKPVFAYANVVADYRKRVVDAYGPLVLNPTGEWACDGMAVENFGLIDNLMIAESIAAQGWDIVRHKAEADALFTDLRGFVICLQHVSMHFSNSADNPQSGRSIE
jgi:nucleoside 2-deoxyribosyltransferase